ncbi:hypothetical protein P3S68_020476 [Capsicum galapagoense]
MAKSTNVMGCMVIVLFVLFSPLTLATPETIPPIKLELSGASRSTRISVASCGFGLCKKFKCCTCSGQFPFLCISCCTS